MTMKLIIVRHGQTEENKIRRIMGQTIGGSLTGQGISESTLAGKWLKDNNHIPDIVYTSPLSRAKHTGELIQKQFSSCKFEVFENLKERSWGACEGKLASEIKGPIWEQPEIETVDEMLHRAKHTIDFMNKQSYKTILLVTHGGMKHALISAVKDITFQESVDLGPIANTSITIFDPSPKLALYASTKHLE